jgi:hypothetical protein
VPSKARQPKELNQPQESKASCASSTPAKAKGKEAASAAAGGGGGKTSTPTGAKETGAKEAKKPTKGASEKEIQKQIKALLSTAQPSQPSKASQANKNLVIPECEGLSDDSD